MAITDCSFSQIFIFLLLYEYLVSQGNWYLYALLHKMGKPWPSQDHSSVYPMTSSENSLTPIRWSLILFGFGVPRRIQLWNRIFGLFAGYPIMSWYFIWIQGSLRKRYIMFRMYKSFPSHEDGLWDPLSCEEQDSNIQNKMYFWNLSSLWRGKLISETWYIFSGSREFQFF